MDAIRVAKVDNVIIERHIPPSSSDGSATVQSLTGTLHLTPHHLIFSPSSSSLAGLTEEIWIPYPIITLLTRLPQNIQGLYPLQIRTRTFESCVLLFERDREGGAEDVWQSVKDCAVACESSNKAYENTLTLNIASVKQLYAFSNSLPSGTTVPTSTSQTISPLPLEDPSRSHSAVSASTSSGWTSFNPRAEFTRQGVGTRTKAWRFTDINKDYSFSPTYPSKMIVPSRISDSVLSHAGKYRSKGRIPALTYLHWGNYVSQTCSVHLHRQASITRSSQPMVGLKNSRSAQDEKLVECIFTSHHSPDTAYAAPANPLVPVHTPTSVLIYGATTTNLIIDARPTTNAMANVAIGAGTENMENYRGGKKAYLGIDNIHVMRNSLKCILEALREAETLSSPIDRGLLRKSNWLRHISTLLDGALVIVKNVHLNASHVLIHCSDGWDRTAQLSATAQICLDPYYRTFEGFKVLIEKDWLAFGHKFLDRSGHLSSDKLFTITDAPEDDSDDENFGAQKAAQAFFATMQKQFKSTSHLKEISPVFHQFLDCVRQIQRQFPERFEFNEDWLLDVHYHLYSCQFGTFLFNNEKQRRVPLSGKAYIDQTVSVWDYFSQPSQQSKYLNTEYNPSMDDTDSRLPDADQGVLLPNPKDVRFWHRLFRRGDEEMNGSKLALAEQAKGAEVLGPIGPEQLDPVSVEGVAERIASPLSVPYAARSRAPSPAPPASASLPELRSQTTVTTIQSSSSTFTGFNAERVKHLQPNRISKGGPSNGGWGWSQLGAGALTAIQGAAREIKSISTDAISQLRAEASEVDGEMWTKSKEPPDTGIGEGRSEFGHTPAVPNTALPRGPTRLPPESNPWSVDMPAPNFYTSTTTVPPPSSTFPEEDSIRVQPQSKGMPSWNKNPWGEPDSTGRSQTDPASLPTLDELHLDSNDIQNKAVTDLGTVEEHIGVMKANGDGSQGQVAVGKDEVEAAMGGDRKAWDPLGAM